MSLEGKTIVTTRAAAQSSDLRDRLVSLGARVIECPTIEIASPESWHKVDEAISQLNSYDWLLFTSVNAVDQFMKRVEQNGAKCAIQVAAVGSATARKASLWDLNVSLVPKDFRAEGVLDAFPTDLKGLRILFPRAEKARESLPEGLIKRGAVVDIVTVYRTVKAAQPIDVRQILTQNQIDCIVFTSESTIRYLPDALDGDLSLLQHIPVAVIGPITRKAAESYGLQPSIEPERATIPDLVEAIRRGL
jgi:uroporphyrinogen III methyltransferase / synthase